VGSTVNATVSIDRPAATALNIALKTRHGFAAMPSLVTIPAGATSSSFAIRGAQIGVEEITAEPSDPSYIADEARLQVNSPDKVTLQVLSGDKQTVIADAVLPQPVEIRATDNNLIPYPGVTIRATVNAGSTVQPAATITDQDGIVRFNWTPGSAAGPVLRASAAGLDAIVTVTALSRPTFQAGGVLNPASFEAGLSPGSQGVIFGASLAGGRSGQTQLPNWPTQLLGVQVIVNGQLCQLRSVSDGRIDLLAPREIAGPLAEVIVRTPLGDSVPVMVPVFDLMPGLFWYTETGEAAVDVAGTGFVSSQRPAGRGESVDIFATGLGPVQRSATTGLEETDHQVRVLLNGVDVPVVFSGLSPVTLGVYRITALIPDDAPSGVLKLTLSVNTRLSNEASITIR
jgi:uncharacterized protein (TIGR03437 family)